jgi:hypothetical protein
MLADYPQKSTPEPTRKKQNNLKRTVVMMNCPHTWLSRHRADSQGVNGGCHIK